MKHRYMALLIALFALPALAVQFYNSSGLNLGNYSKVKCGNGVACSQSSGNLLVATTGAMENGETMVNSTDDTIRVTSDDNDMTFLIMGYEAKDAILALYPDEGDDNADKFTMKMSAAGVLTFNINGTPYITHTTSTGAVAMTGSLTGDGGDALSGFLQKQVAATATTITAAQCGSSFVNSGAVQMELPEASAVLGCRLTFITGNASNFDINPDNADQILVQTNAVGDAMRNATLGNSITIEAISAVNWAVISVVGTWSDIN